MDKSGEAKNTVDKSSTKIPLASFEPRVCASNEAGPRTSNVMTGTWVPHSMEPARAGANDHLAIKSLKP